MGSTFERYGAIIALVVFLAIAAVTLIGFQPTAAALAKTCATDDNGGCFREWMSVFGDWFSGAATFATIIFLSRQINSSERHHRQMMKLQYDKTYRLAMTTGAVAANIGNWCSQSLAQWKAIRFETYGEWEAAGIGQLRFLREMFDREDFATVAIEIEAPKMQLKQLLESFVLTIARIEQYPARYSNLHSTYIREALIGSLGNAVSYAEETGKACSRHVEYVDSFIGH